MIEMRDFLPGLTRLAVASRQAVDEATFEVYREALGLEVDAEEWEAFTLNCVRYDRFPTWFPKVSEIRDALREWRGDPRLEVEAMAAYERVLEAGNYSPEGGTTWSYRGVREKCGLAAAEAFLAAGSHSAFATTFSEAQRRKLFVQEYLLAARGNPEGRLLPAASEPLRLGSGK
jgi:hypothetical protein